MAGKQREAHNCGTCKWWGSSDEGVYRMCRKTRMSPDGTLDHEDTLAFGYAPDDVPFATYLVCAADFGCSQWEAGGEG